MTLPAEIEVAVLKFIASVADAEKELERTRIQIAMIPDFEPQSFFDCLDVTLKGYLSRNDIRVFLRRYDPAVTEDEINHIFKHIDRDNDARISRSEFNRFVLPVDAVAESLAIGRRSSSLIPYPPTNQVQRAVATLFVQEAESHRDLEARRRSLYSRVAFSVSAAFSFLDRAGFGSIRPTGIQILLQDSIIDGSHVAYEDVRHIFRRLDRDDDGSISYLEFANAILPETALSERVSISSALNNNTTTVHIQESPSRIGTSTISIGSPVLGATINAATSRILNSPQTVTATISPNRYGLGGSTVIHTDDNQRIEVRETIFGDTKISVESPSRGYYSNHQTINVNGTTGRINVSDATGNVNVTTTGSGLGETSTIRVSSPTRNYFGRSNQAVNVTTTSGSGLFGNTTTISASPSGRAARELSPSRTLRYETFQREELATLRANGTSSTHINVSPTRRDNASLRLTTSSLFPQTNDFDNNTVNLHVSEGLFGSTNVKISSPSRYGAPNSNVNISGSTGNISVNGATGRVNVNGVTVDGNGNDTSISVSEGLFGSQTIRVSSPSRYGTNNASSINISAAPASTTLTSRIGFASAPTQTAVVTTVGNTTSVRIGQSPPSSFFPRPGSPQI